MSALAFETQETTCPEVDLEPIRTERVEERRLAEQRSHRNAEKLLIGYLTHLALDSSKSTACEFGFFA